MVFRKFTGERSGWHNLAEVPPGADVVLAGTNASAILRHRLAELGLRPGATVTVVQRTAGGGRIIDLGRARYAIDRATLRDMEIQS